METRCPVCLNTLTTTARVVATYSSGNLNIDCPICGKFELERNALEDILDPQTGSGRKLSSLHRAHIAHKIQSATSPDDPHRPLITSEFLNHYIEQGCRGPTPWEQATNAIQYIGDEVARTGQKISYVPKNLFAIIGAASPAFCGELLVELKERGLLDGVVFNAMGGHPTLQHINLTLDGWRSYDEEKQGRVAGKYGFIAMKFGDAALETLARDTIKLTLKAELNFDVVDMRDIARAGIIDNIMRAQIRNAAFVIVDLTHDNSGAYWEAGYAEGLGKPVIYICEKVKFDQAKTHFDTNHCTTVLWAQDDSEQFRQQLVATLRRSLNLF